MTLVRFIGDPTGYVVESGRIKQPPEDFKGGFIKAGGWVYATTGRTDKRVLINLDQAHLIDFGDDA